MALLLKQSTAFTFRIGPFVDPSTGIPDTGLTLVQADIQISKNGGSYAQTSDATPVTTHDIDGEYQCPLTVTDTNTLGLLQVSVTVPGGKWGKKTFEVVPANIYNSIVANTDNLQVDQVQIGGATLPSSNLKKQYDLTGLLGDTFPANQGNVNSISSGSAAINDAPVSLLVNTGVGAGVVANLKQQNDSYHSVLHSLGVIDVQYEFNIGGDGVPVQFNFNGRMHSDLTKQDVSVYGWDWASSLWEQVGIIKGKTATTSLDDKDQGPYFALIGHVGTGADLGKVRFRVFGTGLIQGENPQVFADQVLVSYAVVSKTVGYDGGAVWIDTVNGTTGIEKFVNGTADNHSKTLTDVNTLLAGVGLSKVEVISGSVLTLGAAQDQQAFEGEGWTLDLNGKSISGTKFHGATVSGVGTGANPPVFEHCKIGTVTLPPAMFRGCGFLSTITSGAVGSYFFDRCHSMVAGAGTPVFDFNGAVGDTDVNFRNYSGGIDIRNMGTTGQDDVSLEGRGQLIIGADVNPANSTIVVRGLFTIVDNVPGGFVAGGGTLTLDANYQEGVLTSAIGAAITSAHGAGAYLTGAGGSPPDLLVSTTIATLATQTSFTLAAGSTDDTAYVGALIVIIDSVTATQTAFGQVSAYTGATKTISLAVAPAFTIAPTDIVNIVGSLASSGSGLTSQQTRDAMKLAASAGAPVAGSVDEKLDNVETSTAGLAGAAMRGTDSANTTVPDNAGISSIAADAVLIKAKTDPLTYTKANELDTNPQSIGGSATAAVNLQVATDTMQRGTIDTTVFTPTTTEFEAADVTFANIDQLTGRTLTFEATEGTMAKQLTSITAYSLIGGRGHFTVTALNAAPPNGAKFTVA